MLIPRRQRHQTDAYAYFLILKARIDYRVIKTRLSFSQIPDYDNGTTQFLEVKRKTK